MIYIIIDKISLCTYAENIKKLFYFTRMQQSDSVSKHYIILFNWFLQ